jgi:hypothetical protein
MPIQTINIGNVVNDGLGDDLRTAFQKVNANFSSLAAELTITGHNLGTSGATVFKQKLGTQLEFRNLVAGNKMQFDETADSIIVNSTSPDSFTRIDTNAGYVTANTGNAGHITLQGGRDIDVTTLGNTITVNTILPVTKILSTFDFGPIGSNFITTTQLALAFANIDFGTITTPSLINVDTGSLTH